MFQIEELSFAGEVEKALSGSEFIMLRPFSFGSDWGRIKLCFRFSVESFSNGSIPVFGVSSEDNSNVVGAQLWGNPSSHDGYFSSNINTFRINSGTWSGQGSNVSGGAWLGKVGKARGGIILDIEKTAPLTYTTSVYRVIGTTSTLPDYLDYTLTIEDFMESYESNITSPFTLAKTQSGMIVGADNMNCVRMEIVGEQPVKMYFSDVAVKKLS